MTITANPAKLKGLADGGYYNGEQLKQAEEQGIEIYLPLPKASKAAAGLFTPEQFQYDAQIDCYQCPQGETLTPRENSTDKNGKMVRAYTISCKTCATCPLRAQCLSEKSSHKTLVRWEGEDTFMVSYAR